MRGLTGAGPTARTFQAAIAAVAALAAVALLVSACSTGGTGARDEGPAHADSVVGAASTRSPDPSPEPSAGRPRVDPVLLVKEDPQVSPSVKQDLQPCVGDEYPVDVSYGDLTGGSAEDVVVNVLTCGDAVGVGSYVYHEQDGAYANVFAAEESPVYAEIDRGDLVVTKQVYEKDDPVSSPSGEVVITYSWIAGRFVQRDLHRTEYSTAVGSGGAAAPESG
ncbi:MULTISPECIES: hypothetical protein [unclassified Streptomyces]|uniref:hypothetical protein n=1 Tax=unclassified Streptomyces TaxID=2593676 RepID=UPI001F046E5D|nr:MULTISPECIES: hypothetical protein [unclassified Streptomyces]MCH0565152.1 hypothetical protein [Streptomyces sp. MUM 2J]MCH0571237.1 hypothetical protein [Streptomyces sp. MUM 136J]